MLNGHLTNAHTRALARTSSELTAVARGNLHRSQRSARGTLAYDKKKGFMDETTGSEELAEKAKDQVAEAAAQVKEAAGAAASEARQFAEAAWHDAKAMAGDLQSACESFVREKPSQALLIALGFGVLIGFLMRR